MTDSSLIKGDIFQSQHMTSSYASARRLQQLINEFVSEYFTPSDERSFRPGVLESIDTLVSDYLQELGKAQRLGRGYYYDVTGHTALFEWDELFPISTEQQRNLQYMKKYGPWYRRIFQGTSERKLRRDGKSEKRRPEHRRLDDLNAIQRESLLSSIQYQQQRLSRVEKLVYLQPARVLFEWNSIECCYLQSISALRGSDRDSRNGGGLESKLLKDTEVADELVQLHSIWTSETVGRIKRSLRGLVVSINKFSKDHKEFERFSVDLEQRCRSLHEHAAPSA